MCLYYRFRGSSDFTVPGDSHRNACYRSVTSQFYTSDPHHILIIPGIVGFSDCPHGSNAIIVYLLLGGSILTVLIVMRTVPSLMTCFRNRNYLNSAESSTFTGCICMFEITFYVLAAANLVVLILGTVWIFQDTDVSQCNPRDEDCCETYVYVTSAFFNVFQYAMYAFTSLYICCVAACIRNMDSVYARR